MFELFIIFWVRGINFKSFSIFHSLLSAQFVQVAIKQITAVFCDIQSTLDRKSRNGNAEIVTLCHKFHKLSTKQRQYTFLYYRKEDELFYSLYHEFMGPKPHVNSHPRPPRQLPSHKNPQPPKTGSFIRGCGVETIYFIFSNKLGN